MTIIIASSISLIVSIAPIKGQWYPGNNALLKGSTSLIFFTSLSFFRFSAIFIPFIILSPFLYFNNLELTHILPIADILFAFLIE